MARGNLFMAHRCGFTQKVLTGTLQAHGFANSATLRRGNPYYDIWAVASKHPVDENTLGNWPWRIFRPDVCLEILCLSFFYKKSCLKRFRECIFKENGNTP
jgi:hypothetical protein